MRFFSCLVFTLIFAAPAFADVTGNARVVDGDTIHIGETKIRLHGIDAPESKQTCTTDGKEWPCGKEATQALVKAISDQPVTCKGNKRDRYKRLLGLRVSLPLRWPQGKSKISEKIEEENAVIWNRDVLPLSGVKRTCLRVWQRVRY